VEKAGEWLEWKTPPEKFTPHVSLGKVSTKEKLLKIMAEYPPKWEPITFRVSEIYILSKLVHDTVVRHVIPLGFYPTLVPQFDPVPFPGNGEYSLNVNWVPPGSTDEDLRAVFSAQHAIRAEVVFKTIEHQQFTKGWGHVSFPSKEDRDKTSGKKFYLKGKELEIFPCDRSFLFIKDSFLEL